MTVKELIDVMKPADIHNNENCYYINQICYQNDIVFYAINPVPYSTLLRRFGDCEVASFHVADEWSIDIIIKERVFSSVIPTQRYAGTHDACAEADFHCEECAFRHLCPASTQKKEITNNVEIN